MAAIETYCNPDLDDSVQMSAFEEICSSLDSKKGNSNDMDNTEEPLTLQQIVATMQPILSSEDEKCRYRGTLLLSEILKTKTEMYLNAAVIHLLVVFFCSRLDDIHCIVPCIDSLCALLSNHGTEMLNSRKYSDCVDILTSIVKSHTLHVQSLPQSIRQKMYELVSSVCCALSKEDVDSLRKETVETLLTGLVSIGEGERDPRCLLLYLRLIPVLVRVFRRALDVVTRRLTQNEGNHASNMGLALRRRVFDCFSPYFPITFQPPPSDPYGLTHDMLVTALLDTFACDSVFIMMTIPHVVKALKTSALQMGKIQAMKLLLMMIERYNVKTLFHTQYSIQGGGVKGENKDALRGGESKEKDEKMDAESDDDNDDSGGGGGSGKCCGGGCQNHAHDNDDHNDKKPRHDGTNDLAHYDGQSYLKACSDALYSIVMESDNRTDDCYLQTLETIQKVGLAIEMGIVKNHNQTYTHNYTSDKNEDKTYLENTKIPLESLIDDQNGIFTDWNIFTENMLRKVVVDSITHMDSLKGTISYDVINRLALSGYFTCGCAIRHVLPYLTPKLNKVVYDCYSQMNYPIEGTNDKNDTRSNRGWEDYLVESQRMDLLSEVEFTALPAGVRYAIDSNERIEVHLPRLSSISAAAASGGGSGDDHAVQEAAMSMFSVQVNMLLSLHRFTSHILSIIHEGELYQDTNLSSLSHTSPILHKVAYHLCQLYLAEGNMLKVLTDYMYHGRWIDERLLVSNSSLNDNNGDAANNPHKPDDEGDNNSSDGYQYVLSRSVSILTTILYTFPRNDMILYLYGEYVSQLLVSVFNPVSSLSRACSIDSNGDHANTQEAIGEHAQVMVTALKSLCGAYASCADTESSKEMLLSMVQTLKDANKMAGGGSAIQGGDGIGLSFDILTGIASYTLDTGILLDIVKYVMKHIMNGLTQMVHCGSAVQGGNEEDKVIRHGLRCILYLLTDKQDQPAITMKVATAVMECFYDHESGGSANQGGGDVAVEKEKRLASLLTAMYSRSDGDNKEGTDICTLATQLVKYVTPSLGAEHQQVLLKAAMTVAMNCINGETAASLVPFTDTSFSLASGNNNNGKGGTDDMLEKSSALLYAAIFRLPLDHPIYSEGGTGGDTDMSDFRFHIMNITMHVLRSITTSDSLRTTPISNTAKNTSNNNDNVDDGYKYPYLLLYTLLKNSHPGASLQCALRQVLAASTRLTDPDSEMSIVAVTKMFIVVNRAVISRERLSVDVSYMDGDNVDTWLIDVRSWQEAYLNRFVLLLSLNIMPIHHDGQAHTHTDGCISLKNGDQVFSCVLSTLPCHFETNLGYKYDLDVDNDDRAVLWRQRMWSKVYTKIMAAIEQSLANTGINNGQGGGDMQGGGAIPWKPMALLIAIASHLPQSIVSGQSENIIKYAVTILSMPSLSQCPPRVLEYGLKVITQLLINKNGINDNAMMHSIQVVVPILLRLCVDHTDTKLTRRHLIGKKQKQDHMKDCADSDKGIKDGRIISLSLQCLTQIVLSIKDSNVNTSGTGLSLLPKVMRTLKPLLNHRKKVIRRQVTHIVQLCN